LHAHRLPNGQDSDLYWAVYITDKFTVDSSVIYGMTLNNQFGDNSYQGSFIFKDVVQENSTGNGQPPGTADYVASRVAIHEITHQILVPGGTGSDQNGHRGTDNGKRGQENVAFLKYLAQTNVNKRSYAWDDEVNIMNPNAHQIPDEHIMTIDPQFGTTDRLYFYSQDILSMRMKIHSPGLKN